MTNTSTAWTCHAKPARTGRTCGHVNTVGVVHQGLTCCESCGCTKIASDARRPKPPARSE